MIKYSQRVSLFAMRTVFLAGLLFAPILAEQVSAQEAEPFGRTYRETMQQQLAFEAGPLSSVPQGWTGDPATISVDSNIFHGGKASVRIERNLQSASTFSAITKSIPIDFTGTTLELRGYLRTSEAAGTVGLWMREDGIRRALQFDNMDAKHLAGTHDWAEYSITLPLDPHASTIFFGVLLQGPGTAWADDLQVLVDGKPLWQVASAERPKSILETDHEFDGGSKVKIDALSKLQIDNLATLARVWGFLKYHHPAVTAGTKQWDFELFRIMPSILSSPTTDAAHQVLANWIEKLGPVPACNVCAPAIQDVQLKPRLQWLSDTKQLGMALSERLTRIYENRFPNKQFYVELTPNVGNPDFGSELPYDKLKLPDSGYRLLALFRFWNIIEYWYPNRDLIDEDWLVVLKESIPSLALAGDDPDYLPNYLKESIPSLAPARDDLDYERVLLKLIAHVHDTHANLWGSLRALPPEGECKVPAAVRFVGNTAVVSGTVDGESQGIQRGDVITGIDGVPLTQLLDQWRPYYDASNEATQLRDISRTLLRGACGTTLLNVERGGEKLKVEARRAPIAKMQSEAGLAAHDLPGDTFRLLSSDVAYLKLSSVKASDIPGYINAAAKTKGLIVDIRNYPSEFVVFALGSLLVDKQTEFARFTTALLSYPGAFNWTDPISLIPRTPHYDGKVIILVDEMSQSQSEYTAMALRASPRAIVIGSTTAGADGNVSFFFLPGNLRTGISGIGVFYPDKRPTQRVGIVPDIRVIPTVEGIRSGADEVLERALREILGKDLGETELRKLYR